MTNFEKNLKITNNFFRGGYTNKVNKLPNSEQDSIANINLTSMHFNQHLSVKEIETIESPLKVVLKKNNLLLKNKPQKTNKEDKENVNINFKKHKIGAPNTRPFGESLENKENPFMA